MLVLSRDCDTVVHIGPDVQVKVLSIGKRRVKLGIEAPRNVRVWRDELVSELAGQGLSEEDILGASVGGDRFPTLIVEDDPAQAQLISKTLRQCGQSDLKVAYSGADAIEALGGDDDRDRPAFQFVLLDLRLPDMSGLDVLRHVRSTARLKTTPVVMLSAEDRESVIVDCLEAGANAFVTKSADFGHFRKSLARITAFWGSEPSIPHVTGSGHVAGHPAKAK